MLKEFGGLSLELRSLTRGELKSLRKKGFNLGSLDPTNADEAIDEVINIILGEEETKKADSLPNKNYVDIFGEIIKLTFGGETEKNLLKSGEES